MKNQKLKGNLMMLLTALIWGVSFISQSKGVENLSPLAFNGIRSILGGLVLLPVIFLIDRSKIKKGILVQKPDKTLFVGGTVCGLFMCIASTLQSMGMVQTSPGKAGFITALYMIIVPIIGLFIGKKPTKSVAFAVVVAVISLYLMCVKKGEKIVGGDILVLICSFFFSLHILAIDYFSPKADGVKLSCIQFFVCGVIDMILAFIFDMDNMSLKQVTDCWLAIGYSGILSCGVAYTLQMVAQKYTDPPSASILMSLESVFSTLATVVLVALGWDLTGGQLDLRQIIGCSLMFVAILLVQMPEKNTAKNQMEM